MNGNDPHDDAGNRALDYAENVLDEKLAEMDLAALCEEFDIGLMEGLNLLEEHNDWQGISAFCVRAFSAAQARHAQVGIGLAQMTLDGSIVELWEDMLCAAIRANEGYRQQLSEKLQEQHRAGEVDDWMAQDAAEERAREREELP